jgi:hypothetical protein
MKSEELIKAEKEYIEAEKAYAMAKERYFKLAEHELSETGDIEIGGSLDDIAEIIQNTALLELLKYLNKRD